MTKKGHNLKKKLRTFFNSWNDPFRENLEVLILGPKCPKYQWMDGQKERQTKWNSYDPQAGLGSENEEARHLGLVAFGISISLFWIHYTIQKVKPHIAP